MLGWYAKGISRGHCSIVLMLSFQAGKARLEECHYKH